MNVSIPDPSFKEHLTDDDEKSPTPEPPAENQQVEPETTFTEYFNLVVTRVVFAIHLCVTTWKTAEYADNNLYYGGLVIGLVIMALETVYAVIVKKGKGYQWISPTILIYLWTILPMVWRLELFMFDQRVDERESLNRGMGTDAGDVSVNDKGETVFTKKETKSPLEDQREWVSYIEQVLIFTLIIGRWMLPKGQMSRDEVTRLLMSYIGMSADIIGFFEAFTVFEVMYNETLTYVILIHWSVAVFQFAFVIAAARGKVSLNQYTDDGDFHVAERENFGCGGMYGSYWCDSEVVGCLFVMFMQDLPFFVLRVIMSAKFGATHYMHTFFIGKNILVCIIMLYKMFGASIDRGMKQDYDEIEE